MNSGLLIFREVAESWNSGNSTKSREIIHKTRIIPQNSSVILSNTYLYNIFWNFTCMFTCCKLANLYWNFVTETSKQCPKSTGVDYVAKNCMALALMLRWLNTVWQFVSVCHLPNHGKRKVAAHKLKLGRWKIYWWKILIDK